MRREFLAIQVHKWLMTVIKKTQLLQGFRRFEGNNHGFCTEHLLYPGILGIRLLPFHFGCLGKRPGGDLARRMGVSGGFGGMFGCWSTDRKWGASRGESSPSFLESVNGAVGHVLQVQPVPGCVFFFWGGGGLRGQRLMFFFMLKIAWGVFGHDEKNHQGMGLRQEIPRNPNQSQASEQKWSKLGRWEQIFLQSTHPRMNCCNASRCALRSPKI